MGSDQHRTPCKIICVLCAKSDETDVTGALSSKDNISAHQNCLLYASGIYCKNSPTYDDLFGFTVDDVKEEIRRGKKLSCHHCKRRGATAGCDVKRCKRSYHYPCAIEENAKVIEDCTKGRFVLFCEKHNPDNKTTSSLAMFLRDVAKAKSLSGLNQPERHGSSDSHGHMSDRRESNSSTGSSELGFFRIKKLFPQSSEASPACVTSDVVIQTCIDPIYAPVESDMDDTTPPKEHNTAPAAEGVRPCEELNASSTGSVCGVSTSGLNHTKADNPRQHNNRIKYDSPASSPETPRRKKKKLLHFSDDENSPDPVVSPVVPHVGPCTPQKQHNHSTPVNENTRPCEGLNPSSAGDDDDDTDIDLDVSQSLLLSEPYKVTVPCNVIIDSGPSIESENSLETFSPSRLVPAHVRTSPGSVAASQPAVTNITAPEPKASTNDPLSPGSADNTPHQECSDNGPANQPGSPDHSPLFLPQSPDVTADDPAECSPLEVPSTSLDRPACGVDAIANTRSSAATFWARCNEAGCTEEIFSELLSQLSSLGKRIQSRDARQQDFDVALNVLEASGQLPAIITQLEQDLEKQEQELQRKIAALKDARAVLGIQFK